MHKVIRIYEKVRVAYHLSVLNWEFIVGNKKAMEVDVSVVACSYRNCDRSVSL